MDESEEERRLRCYREKDEKEMSDAWDYFVRTGDFSLVNKIREQERIHAFYMNRYD